MNRRQLLATIGSIGTVGCTNLESLDSQQSPESQQSPQQSTEPSSKPANRLGDFVVWNDDEQSHEVSLTVTEDSETVINANRTLESGESTEIENTISKQGTYQVEVFLDNNTTKETTWSVKSCDNSEYLQIRIYDSSDIEINTMRRTIVPTDNCE